MKKLDVPVEEDREVPGKVSGTFFIHRKIHSIAEEIADGSHIF